MTAKGNEISPAKMPLMRIRSVEIVFEDEMSTCTDTGILDRSLELILSDSSDDSTKCVDDLEHLIEKEGVYDSVTLNADGNLSEDNSVSLKEDVRESTPLPEVDDSIHIQTESLTLPHSCNVTLSPNASEFGDSGRFTEDANSSHLEAMVAYDDALLSQSYDVINVEAPTAVSYEIPETSGFNRPKLLYEYIDSNSESSDDTATCDADLTKTAVALDDSSVDGFDQYDSFIDMGKF